MSYAPDPMPEHVSRVWATLIHLGGILFFFLPAMVGFTVLGDRGAFIRTESRSALNFQLTVLVGYAAGFLTAWLVVGLFVLLITMALSVVFSIMAAVEASRGVNWAYPVTIPFIKA